MSVRHALVRALYGVIRRNVELGTLILRNILLTLRTPDDVSDPIGPPWLAVAVLPDRRQRLLCSVSQSR